MLLSGDAIGIKIAIIHLQKVIFVDQFQSYRMQSAARLGRIAIGTGLVDCHNWHHHPIVVVAIVILKIAIIFI